MCFFCYKFEVFRIVLKEESNYGKMDKENDRTHEKQHKNHTLQALNKRIRYSRNQRGCKNWYYEKN